MKKRLLSLCLVFVLLFALVPATSAADVQDERAIYTEYLLNGGYTELSDKYYKKEYMKIETCMIDVNSDGVWELLISLTDESFMGPRGYQCYAIRESNPICPGRLFPAKIPLCPLPYAGMPALQNEILSRNYLDRGSLK